MTRTEIQKNIRKIQNWQYQENSNNIRKIFIMKDFTAAIALIDKIAKLAKKMDHHPDVSLSGYRRLEVKLTTHSIKNLSKKDFVLAKQIDELPKKLKLGSR